MTKKIVPPKPCNVDGCTGFRNKHSAKGMCHKHYERYRTHGRTHRINRKPGEGTFSCGYHKVEINNKNISIHRVIAEKALGKPLPKCAVIHHVDGNGLNNANSNLVICPDDAYHFLLHRRQRAYDACGHADWRKCAYCKEYDLPENLTFNHHKACHLDYMHKRYRKMKDIADYHFPSCDKE